jgi:hypothetical protein
MDKNKDSETFGKPPFFSSWRKLYIFVLLFEVALILIFLLITNLYSG